jgi:glycosyltransferase involved in cell wall biosynthesis
VTDFIEENTSLLTPGAGPLVAILMGTMNGARFLPEQLDSLQAQTYQNWVLIASDDGSTDDTLRILKDYQSQWAAGKLIIKEGPKQGFCVNFLSLACDPSIKADYYAFCDQDDVWSLNKLEIGIKFLGLVRRDNAIKIFASRQKIIDKNGVQIGVSKKIKSINFKKEVFENQISGNTMVIPSLAREIILEVLKKANPPSHDWAIVQLISGIGGVIEYCDSCLVGYRKHDDNLIGFKLHLNKMSPTKWTENFKKNLNYLNSIGSYLQTINREIIENINNIIYEKNLFKKIIKIYKLDKCKDEYIKNIIFKIYMIVYL